MNSITVLSALGIAVLTLAANVVDADAQVLPEPQLYALYAWAGEYVQFAEDIHRTGIRWVRVGGWLRRGREETEKALLIAAKNRVHLTPTLQLDGIMHGKTMPLDEAIRQWRELVRTSVERYGHGGTFWADHPEVEAMPIRYWEIWNEPNIWFLTPEGDLTRVEMYAKLLKAASEEIRKADAGARIIAFNTAGGIPRSKPAPDNYYDPLQVYGWRRFIRDVNDIVGVDCYDAVGIHPYTQPKGPEEGGVIEGIRMLRELAREQGFEDKAVWSTEVGFPTVYPRDLQVKDETEQACFLIRLFAMCAAHGVEQVQVMYVTDIIFALTGLPHAFGFFTEPGQWRPQATATKVMIDLLPDPRKGARILSEEPGGVFAYRFQGANGWPIVMAWTCGEGSVERTFAVEGDAATAVDYLGRASELTVTDGAVTIDLSDAPVYVVPGARGDVAAVLGDRDTGG